MNAVERRLARMPGPEKVHIHLEKWQRGIVARGVVEGSKPYKVNIHFIEGKVVKTLCECPDGCAHVLPVRLDADQHPYFFNRFGYHRACKHVLAAIGVAKKLIQARQVEIAWSSRSRIRQSSVMASDHADMEIALAMRAER